MAKIKLSKDQYLLKAGSIIESNSPEQTKYLVDNGLGVVVDSSHTPPAFMGISPYRSEEEIRAEYDRIKNHNVSAITTHVPVNNAAVIENESKPKK